MALMDFLAQLGGGGNPFGNQVLPNVPAPVQQAMMNGGMGMAPKAQPFLTQIGGEEMVATPPNMMEQIRAAQAQPELRDPFAGQAAQAPAAPKQFSGLRDTLGRIGDYLLQANDLAPIYAPRKAEFEQKQSSEAVAQYLGRFDPMLGDVARRDPKTGMQLLQALREDKRFDRSAGQQDRSLDQGDRRLDLGYDELGERSAARKESNRLTEQGQTLEAKIQAARLREAQADREARFALQRGDQAHAERMLGLQQGFQREIVQLEAQMKGGGSGGTITEVIETPARGKKRGLVWLRYACAARQENHDHPSAQCATGAGRQHRHQITSSGTRTAKGNDLRTSRTVCT